MTVPDKLNQLIQVKSDLKAVLKAKGLITDATVFSAYPEACQRLVKPVEIATLTFRFVIRKASTTTITANLKFASSSKFKACIIANDVNYFDTSELKGKTFLSPNKSSSSYEVPIQVPVGTRVSYDIWLPFGVDSTTSPTAAIQWDKSTNVITGRIKDSTIANASRTITFTMTNLAGELL